MFSDQEEFNLQYLDYFLSIGYILFLNTSETLYTTFTQIFGWRTLHRATYVSTCHVLLCVSMDTLFAGRSKFMFVQLISHHFTCILYVFKSQMCVCLCVCMFVQKQVCVIFSMRCVPSLWCQSTRRLANPWWLRLMTTEPTPSVLDITSTTCLIVLVCKPCVWVHMYLQVDMLVCPALVCILVLLIDVLCKLQSLCCTAGEMCRPDRPSTPQDSKMLL